MNTALITPLTNQQVFDNALFGIRQQNYVASGTDDSGFNCLYRGPGGLKCGIGHSIPDELYRESMEGKCIGSLTTDLEYRAWFGVLLRDVSLELATRLQDAHDSAAHLAPSTNKLDPGAFEVRMEGIASRFDLTYTEVPA